MNGNSESFDDMLLLASSFFADLHSICQKYTKAGFGKYKSLSKPHHSKHGYDSDDEKPKKAKKKTMNPLKDDPDAPKRPIIQGYLLYYKDIRQEKKEQHPDLNNMDLTRVIGQEWNDLPKEKKMKYEIEASENKKKYESDLDAYLKKNPKAKEIYDKAKGGSKKKAAPTQSQAPKVEVSSSSGEESDSSDDDKALSSSSSSGSDSESEAPKPKKKVKK
mmetsp:Transcript_26789/g.23731  ORF Transcript_26789/g.23731 Transcript_26789/m.23731 type:complete len:218 (-) Transcript_26789:77-730(-)|eukprot:CAMPEP_0114588114 /NCGR_PEP_ID=MMETSP0125-20121206/10904_1 /TAXON_ID=485358 ORGANISM="Aristerostoma sp., Strain ATCC 50986" /NCGR_SAMPLE_ID=MMETSP0125 /ASSEMBLY_ACC=CAM_ASM_000245 /LENGTH=217 /DNA_ID=CAMNT_0001784361 /DNA_START=29 /DNA_END=682 /DNA_ORIENTATION=-